MAEMLLVDNLKELHTLIDQQHLLYLELDENPKKIEQRNKLESYIREYLCLSPHDIKFTFQQTANVLHQSASSKNNFSAYKAAMAWKAIGKYADNLISHPWRKEFRDIKLYCGFYKHEIEESLVGAELMFEAMGYRHAGHSSMALPGILDPDRITSVSKDAIIAFVECQIMKQIWESLSSHFNITWLEILEFRENHTGTPEQVIRALTYKHRQRQYQEQLYHRPQTHDNHFSQPDGIYGQHMLGYYNHPIYPSPSYSYPIHSRNVMNPQQIMPSPMYPTNVHPTYVSSHHILKPQDTYPVNGYHMHPHYSTQMSLQHVPMMPMMCPVPSVVPTGQLIELDSSPTYNRGCINPQRMSNIGRYNLSLEEPIVDQDCLKNDMPSLSSKAKDDGAGSWENWDYVYRNLESHGYRKEPQSLGELSLKENQPSSSQNNSGDVDLESMIQTDFPDKFRKMNIDSNSQMRSESGCSRSQIDGLEDSKPKISKEKFKVEPEKSKEFGKAKVESKSKISPKKEVSRKSSELGSSSNSVFSKASTSAAFAAIPTTSKDNFKPRRSREEARPLIVNLDDAEEKWQCVTCTYLNSCSSSVCEMCYKSRERGSEATPQPSGGAECPKCTLVNEPGLTICAACSSSLKDSPTYI